MFLACNETSEPAKPEANKSSVLEMIEAAYPNPVTLDSMCRYLVFKFFETIS